MMSETRYKLHPISAALNFLKGLKELIVPFLIVFGVNLFQGGTADGSFRSLLPLIGGAVVLLFLLISGIVKWKRFVYWFEEGELRIEFGLFVKKKRYIPFERIQSLNYTEGLLHRPFGLVKVKVETAGGSGEGAEAELTAIPKVDADRIQAKIEEAKHGFHPVLESGAEPGEHRNEEKELQPMYRISMKELLILATTSGGIGVVISGVAVFFSQFSELIPYEAIYNEVMLFLRFGFLIVAMAVFLGLLIAWIVSVALTVFANYQFTIQADTENIVITRGLLEKRKVTLPFKRIQGIKVSQNPLRELFGYATVTVESAGGGLNEGKEDKIRLFPLIKQERMIPVLEALFPDIDWTPELVRAPKRSVHFFYRLHFLWILPAAAAIGYFLFPYGLFFLLVLPLLILLGIWRYRTAGFAITGKQLTIESRGISKHRFYMVKKRIQAIEVSQSVFQRRKQVASVEATIKSGLLGANARADHMEELEAARVLAWFGPSEEKQ